MVGVPAGLSVTLLAGGFYLIGRGLDDILIRLRKIMSNILEVKDLNMQYKTSEGFVKAIQDVSFDIPEMLLFG